MSTAFKFGRTISRQYSAHAGDSYGDSAKLWKRITFFVGFPCITLCMVNSVLRHEEEHADKPEFVPYEHLRIRTKRYPWGDGNHTLFHNAHVNPLPTGYEE